MCTEAQIIHRDAGLQQIIASNKNVEAIKNVDPRGRTIPEAAETKLDMLRSILLKTPRRDAPP
jgi:hypothetical protein